MEISLQPIVLSGGSGTRLWPYSRQTYPKQLLPLAGERTLLQQTVLRTHEVGDERTKIATRAPIVVCNELHRFLVAEQLQQIDASGGAIVLEPFGRNTAPALTLAARLAVRDGADPVLVVMPSDHLIPQQAVFRKLLSHAVGWAQQGCVATFGIVPDRPETGFGYIRKGAAFDAETAALAAFVEKPGVEQAQAYLDSGQYLWNSGIFVLRASVWLDQIAKFRPDIAKACTQAVDGGHWDGDFFRADKEAFARCPADSIDYAVMEKLSGEQGEMTAVVLPLDAGWTDLGSWPAVQEIREQDAQGNVIEGDVFARKTTHSLLYAQDRFLAVIGADNLIVIETPDAVLVCNKDNAQEIGAITDYLKQSERSEHMFHRKLHRPWGASQAIDQGARYRVQRLTVKPGSKLTMQMHHHRAEHWIVVSGTAQVTRGEETFRLTENESTFIPPGMKHRLENPGSIPLEIIEVRSGGYLGEDDIIRFEGTGQPIDG
jgi:mannose-1-phosphate guanylyltransferase/mannose-6-phosphate isomerase